MIGQRLNPFSDLHLHCRFSLRHLVDVWKDGATQREASLVGGGSALEVLAAPPRAVSNTDDEGTPSEAVAVDRILASRSKDRRARRALHKDRWNNLADACR
jgi:hypothetical protein